MAQKRILIVEDVFTHANRLAAALESKFVGAEIDWTTNLNIKPVRWTQPIEKASQNPTDELLKWDDVLRSYANQYDLFVVDLQLSPPACSECVYCTAGFHGIHFLNILSGERRLGRAFVSTGQAANFDSAPSEVRRKLDELIGKGLSVFHKPARADQWQASAEALACKASAWLNFEGEGYEADHIVRDDLYRVGREGEHVLILGSTGTGKERAAELIHKFRGEGAVKTILCGALLSGGLAKSELFGHVKGAFTDANAHRVGALLDVFGVKATVKSALPAHNRIEAALRKLKLSTSDAQDVLRQLESHGPLSVSELSAMAGRIRSVLQTAEQVFASTSAEVVELLAGWWRIAAQAGGDPSWGYRNWILSCGASVLEPVQEDSLDIIVKEEVPQAAVFMDEFQDLPLEVQAMLMRLLEQGEMEVLGYNGKIRLVDRNDRLKIRVIGASNHPLVRRIAVGDESEEPDRVKPVEAPEREAAVRADLVLRLARRVVVLPDLRVDEVDVFVSRFKTIAWRQGSDGPIEVLRDAAAKGRFIGHRRQLRQVIATAESLARYEFEAGRQLLRGEVPEVDRSHAERALHGIRLRPAIVRRSSDKRTVEVGARSAPTPVGVANALASRLQNEEQLTSTFYGELGRILSNEWDSFGIGQLRDQYQEPRKLTDAVAHALFENCRFGDKVLASVKTKKVKAWKNDPGRARDKVYDAFVLAAKSWPGEVGRWPE